MATLMFCDFEDALDAIETASSTQAIDNVIDQVDQQFNAGTLEVTPTNWGHLASAVLIKARELAS
ncbi:MULTISPECIES: hypothetical protein [Pseudomonas syringae group]|uniref:hypothetical protein n=1 Tax=Pseudomonas syringae group TaxID=136849 RepID=UPI000F00B3D6|nr:MULTISPECIES: hypothetical protein [Pseudomonas syringae group]MDH4602419.1 hypothetical protein [Pseudomonas syringae pv. papulans]